MANVSGIAIVIKAFLPTGKTLDEQFAALSIVKNAHASGDYSPLLATAQIDEVKAEQKVRRMEDAPVAAQSAPEQPEQPDTVNGVPYSEEQQPGNFEDGLDQPRINPDDVPEDALDMPMLVEKPKRSSAGA